MKQNPWLGLATYDEQAVAQGYKFCGRERAIKELYSIIDNNLLTTLYGKSGIGKSSLLQAGVFPCLRNDNYLPVMIRLGVGIAGDYSYTTVVMDAVRKAVAEAGGHCVATQEGEVACEEERLWHFFHSTGFQSAGGDTLFPVIVLDQFEELYYKDKQQLNLLLKSLYLLVDDSSLTTTNDDDSTNYRLVLSIREDDLFHLEDSIDKLRLTEMKYNRYRLRELTDDEARDVILQPGVNLFNPAGADAIADYIIREAKAGGEEISTAVLSLICSRIYNMQQSTLSADNTSHHITLSQITTFFKQAEGNFLKSFYDDIIKELKSPAKWYYIEDTLVTDEGRRNSVLKSEFDKAVPNSEFLFRGDKSMLRCITVAGTDIPRVEIIHDMLARQMMSSRNERKLKQQAAALRKQRMTAVAIILFIIVLGAVFYKQYRSIVAERNSMLKMQSHYIAEKAGKLIEEGKTSLAIRLLLSVLPENLDKPDRPYVTAIEFALRKANSALVYELPPCEEMRRITQPGTDECIIVTILADSTAKIWSTETGMQIGKTIKTDAGIIEAQFSPDGNYIVTESSDERVKIWRTKTGEQVCKTIEHVKHINDIQFSPDGNYMVTYSSDERVNIWRTKTGEQVCKTIEHVKHIYDIQFSPDGNYIAAVADQIVKLWDTQTWEQVGEEIDCEYVRFSPDGNHMVIRSSTSDNAMIWNIQTWEQVGETIKDIDFDSLFAIITGRITFSPQGNYIIITSGPTARIWDVRKGEQVGEIMNHDDVVHYIRFSPNENHVIAITQNGTATILNVKTGKAEGELKDDNITSAEFSPDGNLIVTTRNHNEVQIWRTQTKEKVGEAIEELDLKYAQFSSKGKFITTYGLKAFKIWDVEKLIGLQMEHHEAVNSVQFSPDGSHIVTASDDHTAKIWNAKTGEQVGATMTHDYAVTFAQFSPNGNYIITESEDGIVKIWEKSGKQIGNTLACNRKYRVGLLGETSQSQVQFNHDESYIVTILKDSAQIWEAKTGQQIGKTMRHDDFVFSARFSRDGNYVITASQDNTARIWDVKTGQQIHKVEHGWYVSYAEFSPDGEDFVTASWDGTIKIWTLKKDEQKGHTIKTDENNDVFAQFSPKGNYIVSPLGRSIIISNGRTGDEIRRMKWHNALSREITQNREIDDIVFFFEGYPRTVQFSLDENYIITTHSGSNIANIYENNTGSLIQEIKKHEQYINFAQFSPDGRCIVTASDDNTIKVTEFLPLQELIDKYRKIYKDWPLTEEELIEYNFK